MKFLAEKTQKFVVDNEFTMKMTIKITQKLLVGCGFL